MSEVDLTSQSDCITFNLKSAEYTTLISLQMIHKNHRTLWMSMILVINSCWKVLKFMSKLIHSQRALCQSFIYLSK